MPTTRTLLAAVAIVPCLVLLAPVAAILLVLLAIASSARAIGRAIEAPFVGWADLIMFDPHLGWKARPGLDVHYLAEHDDVFHLETDGEGWPGRRSVEESEVVAIGDSFAFGYGIDTARSFAALTPGRRIKAVGAPGYSMVHGVLLMEQMGERLKGKLVVWLVYLENDLQDNLAPEMRQYRAPFLRRDARTQDWEIVDRHVTPSRWTCSDLDRRRLFPRLCVPGPLADRAYSAADYLIGRAEAACRRAEAQLVIVTVPHPAQLTPRGERQLARSSGDPEACDAGLPDRELGRSCRNHDVLMVAGREHLSPGDYKPREGIHWSPRGHRRIAALIGDLADTIHRRPGAQRRPFPTIAARPRMLVRARALAARPSRSSTT